MNKMAALIAASGLAFACGTSFAVNPAPVVITNTTVPVSGSVAISSGSLSVTNTQSTPLYVVSPPAGAQTTSLLYSGTVAFTNVGTRQLPAVDVRNCSQIRLGVGTTDTGDTVAVVITNDLGYKLDQFVVGTASGGAITQANRVYDIPGLSVGLSFTLQNAPTFGPPITVALWCR